MIPTIYKTIVSDPPWNESGGGKVKRGADRHYPLLKSHEIVEVMLTSGRWCIDDEGAHLYLWVTNNHLEDGLFVMRALGFRYVTTRTWSKDRIGLGQYWRGQTEPCLFGVRGRQKAKVRTESTLVGKGIVPRGKHSAKPQVFYDEIEKVSPGPYLEMFARQPRPGWTTWGNEVEPAPTIDTTSTIREALDAAKPHVYRQQHAGKHEQDKLDAKDWLERDGDL